jgi:hypothetical protein
VPISTNTHNLCRFINPSHSLLMNFMEFHMKLAIPI